MAIADGRLDEAFRVLQSSKERTHRDGQKLIDRLAAAFVKRAGEQLASGNVGDADLDCQKALQLAGRQPEVTEIVKAVSVAKADRQQRQQRRQDALNSAQQQMQVGAFSMGARLLGNLDDDESRAGQASRKRLAERIDSQKLIIAETSTRLQKLVDAGEFQAAVAVLASLPPEQRAADVIVKLSSAAIQPLLENGLAELHAGRLDRVAQIISAVATVSAACPLSTELQGNLSRCYSARWHLEENRLAEAEHQFAALRQMLPDCAWVKDAHAAVAEAIRHLSTVQSGPLGLLPNSELPSQPNVTPKPLPEAPLPVSISSTAGRNILQVDGVGRLLMLSADEVTIGASASVKAFDVSILTEGAKTPVFVRRYDDDYFVESSETISVNGCAVTRKLLSSGDTIAIGARGRLRFVSNVAASSSAVLQVTGARLAERDVRSVVLMSDSLLFGPAGSHFRLPDVESPIVLHPQAGGYALRQANSGPHSAAATLNGNESTVIADTRFALV